MYDPMSPFSKNIMPTMVSISHLLARNQCTYDETDRILDLLQEWIKERRECNEYETCRDYALGNKSACMDNVVITPFGHVDENLNAIL